MKKTFIAFTFSSLFMACAVQATDHSAGVEINGMIAKGYSGCTVTVGSSYMQIDGDIESLPTQGESATKPTNLAYSVIPTTGEVNYCFGKVALQLRGVVDTADGTTLANTLTGEGAAKGVGIALFNPKTNEPYDVNNTQLEATSDGGAIGLQMVKLNGQTPVEGDLKTVLTIDIVRL
ncbi:type 1 fimbrial protein [Enterobacter sp. 638]|uniref:Fimbrial protein n=1 Tax=Enterobacter sp. (strain 638) TaxID=399742 RepID=A0A9J9GDW1_ENT38|nr:type 1 fimbrial protein [Enterobacter sp. 638]ABP58766.1 hypothetical protein Ent638_0076 [Enterobacter sp. 638]